MKASQFFVSTLKEAPADAEVTSHKLMTRAGMIKKLGTGIYNYMPMGLRVIRKVENIVREEMNRAGAVELTMPFVQPAELWNESGRFAKMGPELLRVKDRHDRDFVLQPTSEEAVTDIARQELRSYKQLPKNFYQIQTKFRDERRPRFGIMRGREFTMKDAYSFDRDQAAAKPSYDVMRTAYRAIFDRFGLKYRAVAADSGAIGGDLSEEFQVIADTGEDALIYSTGSDYAANIELAEAVAPDRRARRRRGALTKTPTPGKSTCADVATLLGLPLTSTVKSLVLATDELDDKGDISKVTVWLLLLRGDHDMNEVKVGKIAGLKDGFRFATVAEIDEHFGCKPGYLGPIGAEEAGQGRRRPHRRQHERLRLRRQRGRLPLHRRELGARPARARPRGRHPQRRRRRSVARRPGRARDRPRHRGGPRVLPRHQVLEGDERDLPRRDGQAAAVRDGLLRHRRHAHRGRRHRAEPRRPRHHLAGRAGAVHGGDLPDRLRPQRRASKAAADKLHDELAAVGVDVLLDDRGERPGAMFADWELIGVPQRVVISDRGLKEGQLEVQGRREDKASTVALADIVADLRARLAA